MDENDETQVVAETITGTTEPQPTVEELQKVIEEQKAEIDRKEKVIKDTKASLRRGVTADQVQSLQKEIRDQKLAVAEMLDEVVSRVSGEFDENKPQRKTFTQRVQEEDKPPQIDPAEQAALEQINEILDEKGWDVEGDEVREATVGAKTPKQALKMLQAKVKELDTEKLKTDSEKEIADKIKLGVEKALKDRGFTSGGADTPGGSSGRIFTAKQIEDMPMDEYIKRKPEIDEAMRQGRIKQ